MVREHLGFFPRSSRKNRVPETDRVAIEKEKIQRFELLVPGHKPRLEPILLTLRKGQVTPRERPHEGEEFGFVLRGEVTSDLEKNAQTPKGECFLSSAEKEHWIQNTSSRRR